MRTFRFGVLGLAAVVAMGAVVRGVSAEEGAEPTPASLLEMTLRQDQMQIARVAGPVLDDPRLKEADKEMVRKAIKPMQDTMAAMKKNAEHNPTTATIDADQQKVVQASMAMITLLDSRKDLMWIQRHGQQLLEIKGRLLQDKPGEFMKLIEAAGADAVQVKRTQTIMEKFKEDFDALGKQAAAARNDTAKQMNVAAALSEKSLAAIKEIDGLLAEAQEFDFDWVVVKAMGDDADPMFLTLGYSSQPGVVRAPEDGTYVLKSEGKDLAKVTLKKGQEIGFRKTDKVLNALAGGKIAEVPEDGTVHWELVKR